MGWVGSGWASPGGGDGVASREGGHLSSRSVPRQGTGQVKPEGPQWCRAGAGLTQAAVVSRKASESLTPGGLGLSEGLPSGSGHSRGPQQRTPPPLVTWPSLCCLCVLTCKVGVSAALTSEGHGRVPGVGGPVNRAERILEPRGRRGPDGGTGSSGKLSAHQCPFPPPTRGLCSAAGLCPFQPRAGHAAMGRGRGTRGTG